MRVRTFVIGAVTGLLVSAGLSAAPAQAATPQPTITSMSAHAGTSAGGQTITVHGTNLGGTVNAVFGTSEFAKVQVVSSTTVRVRTPRVSRDETHYLVLRTRAGLTAHNPASLFSFVNPPSIQVETPGAATRGGTTVTIHGTDLRNVTAVTFGGVKGRLLRYRGDVAIAVVAPKLAAGPHYVVVHTAFGTSNTGRIDYVGPPSITSIRDAYGPAAGSDGFVELYGTNLRDVTSVTVGGHPAGISGNGSYVKGKLVTNVTFIDRVPAHAPGNATIVVTTRYGHATAPSPYRYQAAPSLRWHSSALTDPSRGDPVGLSCPTASFCALVDEHSVSVFDGVKWSATTTLDAGGYLSDVSCSSEHFCVAVAGHSTSYVFDGTAWSKHDTEADLDEVSCPADGACVAVGRGGTATFAAGSWTVLAGAGAQPVGPISCASTSFCMGVADRETAYRFDGSTWSSTELGAGSEVMLHDVSCVSTTYCAAADQFGYVWEYTSSGWARGARVSTLDNPYYVSCTAVSSCEVGLVDGGVVDVVDGTASEPAQVATADATLNVLSCAPGGPCVAVDRFGQASVRRDGDWSPTSTAILAEGVPSGISCVSRTYCLATDQLGNAYAFDGTSWSAPTSIDRHQHLAQPVSCASVDLCATVSDDGVAAVHDAAGWHTTATGIALDAVACASSTCVALSNSASITYTAGTGRWSSPQAIGRSDVTALACASATDCVAAAAQGVLHFDGVTWGRYQTLDGPTGQPVAGGIASVACARTFCLAGTGSATSIRDRSGTWGRVQPDTGFSYGPVACSPDGECLGANRADVETYESDVWSTPINLNMDSTSYIMSVTCPQQGFCATVESDGSVLTGVR